MIYVWKILVGLNPKCRNKHDTNKIRGRMCQLPTFVENARQSIKTQREQTLQVYGVKLFNKLLWEFRIMDEKLDEFLARFPNRPLVGDLVPSICNMITGRPFNSLLDWIPHQHQNIRKTRPR